jgi:hypothetical protein
MKHVYSLAGSLVLTLAAVAHAGPDPWCGKLDRLASYSITTPAGAFKYNTDADDVVDNTGLENVVEALCAPGPDAAPFHAQLEAARARWSKRLGMTDADWPDAFAFVNQDQYIRRGNEDHIEIGPRRTYSEMGALEQYKLLSYAPGSEGDPRRLRAYSADAFGARLTESGRLGYAQACLVGIVPQPVEWAMCWADAEAVDEGKIFAEVRADKEHDGADRMAVRLNAWKLVHQTLPARRAALTALEKTDAGYAKLFELAAATRKDWASHTYGAALDLVSTLDDAVIKNSRDPHVDDCMAQARGQLAAIVASMPAKDLAELVFEDKTKKAPAYDVALRDVLETPSGYLTAAALATCSKLTNANSPLAALLGREILHRPGMRGPRTATLTAMMKSGIQPDDRNVTLEYSRTTYPWLAATSDRPDGHGKVSKVAHHGDLVHVEFSPVMVRVRHCTNEVETGRILGLSSDLRFIYEAKCTAYAYSTENDASRPIDLDTYDGASLKPGMVLDDADGVIIAWAKANAAKPIVVFGVAVK